MPTWPPTLTALPTPGSLLPQDTPPPTGQVWTPSPVGSGWSGPAIQGDLGFSHLRRGYRIFFPSNREPGSQERLVCAIWSSQAW